MSRVCGSLHVVRIHFSTSAVLDPASGPVSATCFNRLGTMQAYALSYDWHKGHIGMTSNTVNKLMLHPCKDEEVRKKIRG